MKRPTAEEVFYDRVYALVNNLLVNNVNTRNNYFAEQSKLAYHEDVKERARYILEEMESMKHMIVDEE